MEDEKQYAIGFDDAIIGTAERAGFAHPVVAYDYEKCVEIIMADGADRWEALDYLHSQVIGAWVGEGTPVFIEKKDPRPPERETVTGDPRCRHVAIGSLLR